MPNPNNAPDPQNVYILEDFFQGRDVEEALLKADELTDTKLEFLQAAQDAVDGHQVSSADELIHTITVVEKVVQQIPVTVDFKYATNIQFTTEGATLKAQLIDQDGAPIGDVEAFSIPTGSVVVDGSYDSTSGNIVLTLESGTTIEIPATAFQDGLQAKIDANNKLSADYLIDGTANKVFTAADKAKVNASINEAGSGLTVYESSGDKIVKHTNSVSAVTTAEFSKVTYDAQGHITGSQPVTKADVTALNLNGADVKMTGYSKPASAADIEPTDTVNQAIGKLEKAVEDAGSGDGTVKSVAVSMPTGFTVTGSPITESGTIAVAMADGYSIPTDTKQAEWDAKLANTVKVNNKLISENPVLDGRDIVLTGYQIAPEAADVVATDTVNEAIGKLQKTIKEGGGGSGEVSSVTSTSDSISIAPTTGAIKVAVASGYTIPQDTDITAWNAKQNALTAAQLDAVNSGITAESVQVISESLTEIQTRVLDQLPTSADLLYASSIDVTIDNSTYVVTFQLKDQKGDNIGSAKTIDLPIESLVMSVAYNDTTKKIIITLQNGTTTEIPVADLTAGLQPTIDASHKVSADYIDDTESTNKFVTAGDKTRIAESVNKVKTDSSTLANISGLEIETDGTDKVITHTNSVDAVAEGTFSKLAYDRHGHITGTDAVTTADITALIDGLDINLGEYTKESSYSPITYEDSVNEAIAKLEAGVTAAISGGVASVDVNANSGLAVDQTTGAVVINTATGHTIPETADVTDWNKLKDATWTGITKTVDSDTGALTFTASGDTVTLTGYTTGAEGAVTANDDVNTAISKLATAVEAAAESGVTELSTADGSHLIVDNSTGAVEISVDDDYSIPTTAKQTEWDDKLDNTTTINGQSVVSGTYTIGGADIDLTGYTAQSATDPISATDDINTAVGKLVTDIESKVSVNIDPDVATRLVFA